ncbi:MULTISPECIES: ABC transporter substrate-binding protein [Fusobacterium]|jgi:iron complex transport system substrate-binding protein|uniref:ABC transporter substrate-binding protein n=1 Tax=Fusobacterium TaxID=848 RepID=UPI0008A50E3E|nr:MULTISPECIES: ABC transporter substrate-binding protein [Fusobacterium]MCI6033847.1 ABC transporter substrate-binding protein [Fusobacterium varium]OFL86691.1 iron ABC transporter [Fusobacterium sp. HMSC073F01]RGJ28664.1 iron ABC transporter [Fusobacterium varium]HBJ80088.1 iron ABC transporter [Fusobacterium sp.]
MKRVRKSIVLLFILMLGINIYSMEIKDKKIIDNYGNSIEQREYRKIVVLDPAVVETFYMLGGESKITAIGKTAMSEIYPVEKTKNLANVGTITKPSIEKILSYTPDLVILNAMAASTGESLKELKIPFIINTAGNISDILLNIKIYGDITGKKAEAEKLYINSEEKLNNLKKKVKESPLNLKGAVLYTVSPMMGFNEKSLPGEILDILGVENIADNLIGDKPIISQEFLLKKNPDFLAGAMSIKSAKDIANSNPAVKETTAGKKGNFFIVDSSKILRGSPRIFEAVEEFYLELLKINK